MTSVNTGFAKRIKTLFLIVGLPIILVGAPLAGLALFDRKIEPYLAFPPLTEYIRQPDFSWRFFALFTGIDVLMITVLGVFFVRRTISRGPGLEQPSRHAFPSWGWLGIAIAAGGWWLAWSRFPWFAPLQRHTFILPWIGYIIIVNAWCVKRSGRCLAWDEPVRFALLWPVSAAFWWFFEVLNRFVKNWIYIGVEGFGPLTYVLFASMAFSTVLPAVLSTFRLLQTFAPFAPDRSQGLQLPRTTGRRTAGLVLFLSLASLFFLGIYPNLLFAIVWVAPLLVLVCLQILLDMPLFLDLLSRAGWGPPLTAAVAALICGFFWELWNVGSLARWEYAVPYVDRFHVFAMPILGYGGYLPFGLECLVVGQLITGTDALIPDA